MAAKQGFTAHISQASEDARRAVLSRAPTAIKSHSWLSNLNTTCTIKSAPPRTPEVMTLLSTKSGWLVKRNEQHVWQRRWFCVVPHTFLYYFEAEPLMNVDNDGMDNGLVPDGNNPALWGNNYEYADDDKLHIREGFSGGGVYRTAASVDNQEELNMAVRECHGRGAASRNKSPLHSSITESKEIDHHPFSQSNDKSNIPPSIPSRGPTTTTTNLFPVGIIDLECYSCVNRSSLNKCVFELTGDSITNPDLRSFYFQASSVEDCEQWTKSLISDRHSALRDEREAYRQVCDSFQLQLQSLSDMIDEAEGQAADAKKSLYSVRSSYEKTRSEVTQIVRDALEQKCGVPTTTTTTTTHSSGESKSDSSGNCQDTDPTPEMLEQNRLVFLDQLDEILGTNDIMAGDKEATAQIVQLLSDYLSIVLGSYTDLIVQMNSVEYKLNQNANIDKSTLSELKSKIERLEAKRMDERSIYEGKLAKMEVEFQESASSLQEKENQLSTQRMEFSMFQSQVKGKLQELSQHKKILKKEVIDLRKRVDEIGSERDAALHVQNHLQLQLEHERQKTLTLEKYIERMENQVRVQQNMMEMMSVSGLSQGSRTRAGNSVLGRIVGPESDSTNNGNNRLPPSLNIRDASPLPNKRPPRSKPSDGTLSSPPRTPRITKFDDATSPLSVSTPLRVPDLEHDELPDTLAKILSGEASDEENNMQRPSITPNLDIDALKDEEKNPNININGAEKDTNDYNSDDDDEKSHVSDLTEDMTQRALDRCNVTEDPSIKNSVSRKGSNAENNILTKGSSDAVRTALFHRRASSEPNSNNAYPPQYIRGGKDKEDSSQNKTEKTEKSTCDESTTSRSISVARKARLDADEKTNVTTVSYSSRYNKNTGTKKEPMPGSPDHSIRSTNGESTTSRSMSVARKARLDADEKTTVTTYSYSSRNNNQNTGTRNGTIPDSPVHSIRSNSPSVFARVFNAIDNSIIGVKANDEMPSNGSTVDTVNKVGVNKGIPSKAGGMRSLSVKERQQLQRERQLQALKKEGLVAEDTKIINGKITPHRTR